MIFKRKTRLSFFKKKHQSNIKKKAGVLTLEVLWWGLTILLFVLSFVGIIYPIIPSVVAIWGGFVVYQFLINPNELSIWFWISMAILSAVLIAADLIANSYFVKKYGGSKTSEKIAAIATIIVGSLSSLLLGLFSFHF